MQDNVRFLLEKYYDGNVSEMQRETGVNRSVISEIKNGGKTEVNSSTLLRFAEAGVNINWLLTGNGRPFMVDEEAEINTELKEKQLLDNRMKEIKVLVGDIEDQLSEQPHLRLDPDVQTALLELLKKAVR